MFFDEIHDLTSSFTGASFDKTGGWDQNMLDLAPVIFNTSPLNIANMY